MTAEYSKETLNPEEVCLITLEVSQLNFVSPIDYTHNDHSVF